MLQRPVLRIPQAATALGAALLAATGTLHPSLTAAAAEMVPNGELIEPDAAESPRLEESYRRFCAELRARGWI